MTVRYLALSGGIGGAKLAFGLTHAVPPKELAVVVNTGDDFEHLGLHVSPDLDTLVYTLAGINNPTTGWGRAADTWSFMGALEEVGGPTWFQLGDKDLALNVLRTYALESGTALSKFTADMATRWGIASRIIPMTDGTVRTVIETELGPLDFQDYFVRRRSEPIVQSIQFCGSTDAVPATELQEIITADALAAIIICPSNPYLSIDPILSVPGIRDALRQCGAPVVAVSPVVAGDSLKGPTAKIMHELGIVCSATAIAQHYRGLVDGLLIDYDDASLEAEIADLGIAVKLSDIVMRSAEDRSTLAKTVVQFAGELGSRRMPNAEQTT
jgi:LPPG:FO 2-phospho-L-lactate transferase